MEYHRLEVRVTPKQDAEITSAAEGLGLSVAAWLRMVALEAARKQLAETPAKRSKTRASAQ